MVEQIDRMLLEHGNDGLDDLLLLFDVSRGFMGGDNVEFLQDLGSLREDLFHRF